MENKLLIFIVAYQRQSYTQGTIELLNKVRPEGSTVIVCDNGSTDGTREWLEENQEKLTSIQSHTSPLPQNNFR